MLGEGAPRIGKQLFQSSDRVAYDLADHIVEVLPRVDAANFTGPNQPKAKSGWTGTSFAVSKQAVLPSYRKRPDGILGHVVVRPETAVFQVRIKCLPPIQ